MIADTNALSAFLAGDAAVAPVFARAAELCPPVIVLGESGTACRPFGRVSCCRAPSMSFAVMLAFCPWTPTPHASTQW